MSSTRQLAAIMFTDIVGYTALMGNNEQKAFELLRKNREIQKPIIEEFGGRWIKELGDGVMASFPAVSNAVYAAIKIQEACYHAGAFELRIGIHQGEVVFENDDIFGDAVNISARLQALAPPGGIFVSASVQRDLINKNDIRFEFVGVENLKNVTEPVQVYKIFSAGMADYSKVTLPSPSQNLVIKPQRKRMLAILASVVLLIALTGYLMFNFTSLRILLQPGPKDKSIAVLPFKNIGSDANDEYFSDGMTEEVINYLAKLGELKVVSRTSVEQYKGGNKDIRSIADELDVSTILAGSVRKAGNKFRITVQLIEAESGFHLWSNEYDREISDVLQIQSDIANEVAEALRIVLTASEKKTIANTGQVETVAYDFYLKARAELLSFQMGSRVDPSVRNAHLQNSIALFKKSIDENTKFAKAYTGLGLAYYLQNFNQNYFKEGFLDSLKVLADKALQIDLQTEEAFYLKGIYYSEEGMADEAIDEFNKALAISPNYADAMMRLSRIYSANKNDFVSALRLEQKATQIDRGPALAGNLRDIGFTYYEIGFIDKSKEYFSLAAPLDGDSSHLYWLKVVMERSAGNYAVAYNYNSKACRGFTFHPWGCADESSWLLQLMGKYKEALDVRLQWEENTKGTPNQQLGQIHRIAWLYWQLGDKKKAKEYFDKMIDYGRESIRLNRDYAQLKNAHYDLAGVYAFSGQSDQAYQYLEEVATKKFISLWMVELIKRDPLFDSIRKEERFKNIVDKMEAAFSAEHNRVQQWLDQEQMKVKLERK